MCDWNQHDWIWIMMIVTSEYVWNPECALYTIQFDYVPKLINTIFICDLRVCIVQYALYRQQSPWCVPKTREWIFVRMIAYEARFSERVRRDVCGILSVYVCVCLWVCYLQFKFDCKHSIRTSTARRTSWLHEIDRNAASKKHAFKVQRWHSYTTHDCIHQCRSRKQQAVAAAMKKTTRLKRQQKERIVEIHRKNPLKYEIIHRYIG